MPATARRRKAPALTGATYGEVLGKAGSVLRAASSTPSLDARLLMEHVLGCESAWLLAHGDEVIGGDVRERFVTLLTRRQAGEPIAYITGICGFYGREFLVTPDVLVPRPESEHLIEAVLEDIRSRPMTDAPIVDIGTGSGALAITLACEMPNKRVYATDISETALAVARRNAERLGVASRVTFLAGDLAEPLAPIAPLGCVVANLPYIKSVDMAGLPRSVGYEPPVALDGGFDGLQLYERLAWQLSSLLAPGASLFFEAAPDTIPSLAELLEKAFPWAHVEIGEDYAGLERYVLVVNNLR